MLNFPNFAEATFPDDVFVVERFLAYFRSGRFRVLAIFSGLDCGFGTLLGGKHFMIDEIIGQLLKGYGIPFFSAFITIFGISTFL